MRDGISQGDLRLIYQWLLNGTSSCNDSGDLWYYRSLVATRLNNARDSTYALAKAKEYRSQAQNTGFDPFQPAARSGALASVTSGKTRNKFALLVGVTRLQHSRDTLMFSGKDAEALGKYLVEEAHFPKDNVKVLTDEDATAHNIREAFGRIRVKAKADDLVLVYLSSHGRPKTMDPTGLSYVMTYDTNMGTQTSTFTEALNMVELAELGRWTLARDYVLILDTCFSGSIKPQIANEASDPLQGLHNSGNRAVLAASQEDERSYEDPEHEHGYFTRFLLEGLTGSQGSSLATLFDYVREHVSTAVSGDKQQHPVARYFGAANNINLNAPIESAAANLYNKRILAFFSTSYSEVRYRK